MTSTPTTDDFATFATDLQRVAHLLATAGDAHRRGLHTETLVALERAGVLVDSLGEVVEWWRFRTNGKPAKPSSPADPEVDPDGQMGDAEPNGPEHERAYLCDWDGCTNQVFGTVQALASHKRKHARDQLKADAAAGLAGEPLPERPAPLAALPDPAADTDGPPAPREMQGRTEQIGVFEVRTIGKRRFIRCPDVMCARRIILTDEETQNEIADAIHSHTVSGDCLARSKPAAKAKRQ